ncbi:MAG: efflux RND transporter permease subunit [Gammaproteobacteria bacterium]|nr:efflux RND transporter permease subunit [Gammaproteobacteria bacterium]
MALNALQFINRLLMKTSDGMAKIPDFTRQHRKKALLSLLLLTVFFAAGIPRIKLDMSMEAFFRDDDPTLHNFNIFHHLFGSDQVLMLMFQPQDGDVFSNDSLNKVKALEEDLNQQRLKADTPLNRITRVRSIYSADFLEASDDALISRKFIGPDGLPLTAAESDALRQLAMQQRDFPGQLFSRNSKLGILMIQTDYGARLKIANEQTETLSAAENDSGFEDDFSAPDTASNSGLALTAAELPEFERVEMEEYSVFMSAFNDVLARHHWQHQLNNPDADATQYLAVGNPWIMDLFFSVVMQEMGLISLLSILLIIIVLYFVVGSLAGTVWPTTLIITGIVWTLGIVGWSGVAVNMMINITVFLILTVGIAASIHILSVFKQMSEAGLEEHEALTETLRKTGLPIMLAALTTMAGMLSMSVIPIAPIKAFALFASVGVFVTFWLTVIYLPTLMEIWSPIKRNAEGKTTQKKRDLYLQRFLSWTDYCGRTYPKTIIATFVIVSAVSLMGLPKVYIDTNLMTLIKPGVGMSEAISAIDGNFGGSSNAEILIDSGRADGIKDPQLLRAMQSLQEKIIAGEPELVTRVDSIVKLAKESYKNLLDGKESNYRIPDSQEVLAQTLFSFESADPATRKLFVDDEWQVARMTIQVKTRGSRDYEQFNKNLQGWIDDSFAQIQQQNPNFKAGITGSIPLMMEMMSYVSKAQINSYLLVIAVIAVLLLVIFGSLRFGVMAMIPNLFPILVLLGVTGWLGIALDTDTLLVMPLAIGIAVDDSIHFLTHYRTELLRGKKSEEAIHSALTHVGQAMIYTSVVLSLGFLIFVFSVHQGLTNFGILSAIAMFSALLADLFLLPAMIHLFKPFENQKHLTTEAA